MLVGLTMLDLRAPLHLTVINGKWINTRTRLHAPRACARQCPPVGRQEAWPAITAAECVGDEITVDESM